MTSKGPTRRRSSVSKGKDTREKEQLKKKGKKEELMQEKLKKTGAKKVSPDLTPNTSRLEQKEKFEGSRRNSNDAFAFSTTLFHQGHTFLVKVTW